MDLIKAIFQMGAFDKRLRARIFIVYQSSWLLSVDSLVVEL